MNQQQNYMQQYQQGQQQMNNGYRANPYQQFPQYMYPQMHPNFMQYPMYYQQPMYQQYYQQQQQQQQMLQNPQLQQQLQYPNQQSPLMPQIQQQLPPKTINKSLQPKQKESPKREQQLQNVKNSQNNSQTFVDNNKFQHKIHTSQQIDENLKKFIHVGFCHFCNKNGKLCYYCFSNYCETECKHGFCFDCLTFKFKQNTIKLLIKPDWYCPVRTKQCNCGKCSMSAIADSEQFVSNDSVESCNKYAHIIENTKKIKKQYIKKKSLIREIYSIKFQNLDPKKKKQLQQLLQRKTNASNKIKRQLQFNGECLQKLKVLKILTPTDEQILHQVIRHNMGSIVEQLKDLKY